MRNSALLNSTFVKGDNPACFNQPLVTLIPKKFYQLTTQSGFLSGYSYTTARLTITDDLIIESSDDGKCKLLHCWVTAKHSIVWIILSLLNYCNIAELRLNNFMQKVKCNCQIFCPKV